jgi:hypothetical protein
VDKGPHGPVGGQQQQPPGPAARLVLGVLQRLFRAWHFPTKTTRFKTPPLRGGGAATGATTTQQVQGKGAPQAIIWPAGGSKRARPRNKQQQAGPDRGPPATMGHNKRTGI